jgi:hypothetical protein
MNCRICGREASIYRGAYKPWVRGRFSHQGLMLCEDCLVIFVGFEGLRADGVSPLGYE